jgi:cell division protein FtsI (penicillin-binding protein 3)
MAVVSMRLVQLQGFDGASYADTASRDRISSVTIPAIRGSITDRNGQPLAITVDSRTVIANPKLIAADLAQHQHDPAQTAAVLSPLLGVPVATILDRLKQTNEFQYLARGLTPAQGDAVTAAVSKLQLAGIYVQADKKREYPAGSLASNVIGFVGAPSPENPGGTPLAGYEYSLNNLLKGHDGTQTGEMGLGTIIPVASSTVDPAVPGTGVQLTIDRDIQWRAQQLLADQVAATGARGGTVTVEDVKTGEILALAVAPTFDSNNPGAAPDTVRGNAAVSTTYEPGSVSKVITMAAALQAGVVTPTTGVTVNQSIDVLGRTFHDAEQHAVEHLTVAGVLAKSSNVGTIQIAQKLGADKLYAAMRAFGFGETTGLGFPGESTGSIPDVAHWSNSTLPTVAFGQGVSVTALQVASVYATIANGGVRVTPTLINGHVAPDGTVTATPPPATRVVVSPEVAAEVRRMLESVTSDLGTAPAARIPGYRVAGKTGTAQRPDGHGGYSGFVSSFVGFAPADDPQLLVSVVLDDPKNGHFGGQVAAPVFREVMKFALQTRRIPPTGTTAQPYPLVAAVRR